MFWIFYVIGGVIGVLIALCFLLPGAYFAVEYADGFLDVIRTIGKLLVLIPLLSCVVFFLSWISVGVFIIYYDDIFGS